MSYFKLLSTCRSFSIEFKVTACNLISCSVKISKPVQLTDEIHIMIIFISMFASYRYGQGSGIGENNNGQCDSKSKKPAAEAESAPFNRFFEIMFSPTLKPTARVTKLRASYFN